MHFTPLITRTRDLHIKYMVTVLKYIAYTEHVASSSIYTQIYFILSNKIHVYNI